jgi:hypothetical protein
MRKIIQGIRSQQFRMKPIQYIVCLVVLGLLLPLVKPSYASVGFENTGTLTGWDSTLAEQSGSNTQVTSPTYKGSTAIRSRQIFLGNNGERYHAEVKKRIAQNNGTDRYYGQAVYFPTTWQFHSQNVTFQQWMPDNSAGPWIMMFLEGTKLRYAKVNGTGTGIHDIMDISTMRGQWIRIVTRIKMTTTGIFEVWINGSKKISAAGDWTTGWASNSTIKWSSGIYCTGWFEGTPTGQTDLSIYHDHFRIATSYSEAEPANWPATVPTNTPTGPTKTPTRTPTRTPTPNSTTSAWVANASYSVGKLVTYGGHTYKCIQAHTSQVGWEPPNTPALWQLIS